MNDTAVAEKHGADLSVVSVVIKMNTQAVECVKMAGELVAKGAEVKVENEDQLAAATTLRSWASQHLTRMNEVRLELTRPYAQAVKDMNAAFNASMDPLTAANEKIGDAIQAYIEERERKAAVAQRAADAVVAEQRRQDEARALEEAQALQAAGKTEEAERVIETAVAAAEQAVAPVMAPAKTMARGVMGGTAYLRKTWEFELDPNLEPSEAIKLVPEHFLIAPAERLDAKSIRAKITSGTPEAPFKIPGLRVFQKTGLAGR